MVAAYTDARVAAEDDREQLTLGYATETRSHPPILDFGGWLRAGGWEGYRAQEPPSAPGHAE